MADVELAVALLELGVTQTTAVIPLTATQLNHLASSPVLLAAAPGAGLMAIPESALLIYTAGAVLYYTEENRDHPQLAIGTTYLHATDDGVLNVDSLVSSPSLVAFSRLINEADSSPIFDLAALVNQPIKLGNDIGDMISYGEVTASTVLDGGSGYNIGDTGGFNENNTSGTYAVTGVDAPDGAVTTYTLDTVNGAQVGQTLTTYVDTGGGDGNFSITANTIAPGNGTAVVILKYSVWPTS